jgi:hypothetical protein
MSGYFAAPAAYGRSLTLRSAQTPTGRVCRGFVQPIRQGESGDIHAPTLPGRADRREYLLIAEPAALTGGETGVTVTVDGSTYELLRAEAYYVGGALGHWEGVLRLKGGGV